MVRIEKGQLEICDRLADELNRSAKKFKQTSYKANTSKYEGILARKDISVEQKKKLAAKNIHELAVKSFSIDLKKVSSQKRVLEALKGNVRAVRKLVSLLRDINYYLQNIFLEELKLAKKTINWRKLKDRDIERLIEEEQKYIGKKEFEQLEYTVFKLIKKTIFLDQKLLKQYKKKEKEIIIKSKVEIKDIDAILKRQSELLCHLEAKLPPPSQINAKLLRKGIFGEWISRVIALIVAFEHEYKKEEIIFEKLKKNRKIRKKINTKVKHLVKEKWELLKLKEARLLAIEDVGKIDAEHQKISHHYSSVSRL